MKWDPKEYGDIKTIRVSPDYLWTPKLFLNDSHYHYGLGSCHPVDCLVKYESEISCFYPCHQTAQCNGDFTDWPFDIQNCSVVFKTFVTAEDVTFDSDRLGGSLFVDSNKRWKILEAKALVNETNKTNVKFMFALQRLSDAYFQHVLVPGYVLICLTLSVLWMKNESIMRTIVCGASIYLHFSLMDRVWWQLVYILMLINHTLIDFISNNSGFPLMDIKFQDC